MFYLGIDLGGTNIKAGIVDHCGNLLLQSQIATDAYGGLDYVLSHIVGLCKNLLVQAQERAYKVDAVGIGVPGPVNEEGLVIRCVNLGWFHVPITTILTKELGMPVYAGNDGNLAGTAEMEVGVLRGVQNAMVLMIGTGIGAGIIVNGQMYAGTHSIGAEVGHMVVGENFFPCNCGRNGCLETFSSASGMIAYAKLQLKEGNKSCLRDLCSENLLKIDGQMIMEAAKNGDEVATKTVDRAATYLGRGIINIVSILDPEKIAIGGGVSKAGEWFLHKIGKAVSKERYFQEFPIPEIVLSQFGNEAGVIGAAMFAKIKNEYKNSFDR